MVVEVKGIAPVFSDAICELEWEASLDRWRVLPQPSCVKCFHHFTWILSLSPLCLTPPPVNSSPLSLRALGLWTLKAFITMLFLEKVKEKAFPDDSPCILLPCRLSMDTDNLPVFLGCSSFLGKEQQVQFFFILGRSYIYAVPGLAGSQLHFPLESFRNYKSPE